MIIKNFFRMLFSVIKAKPSFAVLSFLQNLISSVFPFVEVFLTRQIINALTSATIEERYIAINYIVLFAFAEFVEHIYQHLYSKLYYNPSTMSIKNKIKLQFVARIAKIDYSCYDNEKTYNDLKFVSDQLDGQVLESWNILLSSISALISIGGWISYFIILDPFLLVIAVANAAVHQFVNFLNGKIDYSYQESITPIQRFLKYIYGLFSGKNMLNELRTSPDVTQLLINKFKNNLSELENKNKKFNKINLKNQVIQFFINFVYQVTALAYIAYKIIIGVLLPGDFTSVQAAIGYIDNGISSVLSIPTRLIAYDRFLKKYYSTMDSNQTIEDSETSANITDFETLNFDKVYFKYPDGDKYVLNGISFEIKKGEKVAIVGENGAGKTTILKLLLRLYDPNKGICQYNFTNYFNISPNELRNKFSIVFQDFSLFKLSLIENITEKEQIGSSEIANVEQYLKKLHLYDRIQSSPDGIKTMYSKEFSKNGTELSGGEIQRLLIAKALYQNKDILIFDEPSSSLDPLAESNLVRIIEEIAKDKTLIIITHRLSFAQKADKIICINDGRIIETGTHEELMNISGYYAKMYNEQIGGLQ